ALIQEALGHSEIGTTTIYAHLNTPERHAKLARLLDGEAAASRATVAGAMLADTSGLPKRRRDAEVGPHVATGDRIREIGHGLGLRQPHLAAKLGIGLMTVVRAERGAAMPQMSTLQGIADLGGVSVDWLVRGDA